MAVAAECNRFPATSIVVREVCRSHIIFPPLVEILLLHYILVFCVLHSHVGALSHVYHGFLSLLLDSRFSRPTMPMSNLYRNSIYYWAFAAVVRTLQQMH